MCYNADVRRAAVTFLFGNQFFCRITDGLMRGDVNTARSLAGLLVPKKDRL
ncbi:hypothetical protein B808_366 [Fructilactobacillus florum 8D]|uniref:Uncharacterized protein n=1 Tax=Fructilactobacillus florum 8D TaxID=1221538 RepID=W9ELZ5_9LACO|nr:hypothetical protein B807_90 [Fructilactobacillus florum 2F]ETO40704.1 hypothetical protein B808_366 [Fructilactobacillus florum 8D]